MVWSMDGPFNILIQVIYTTTAFYFSLKEQCFFGSGLNRSFVPSPAFIAQPSQIMKNYSHIILYYFLQLGNAIVIHRIAGNFHQGKILPNTVAEKNSPD